MPRWDDTKHFPRGLQWLLGSPLVWMALALLVFTSSFQAYAATSITPSPGAGSLGTTVTQTGTVYGITGGKQAGTNLFHSFGQFSVATGDTAQFQTPNLIPNASMSNILGRVTGGNPSAIFGAIDSATYYPSANLFLMNPAGFLFGPNASVNVGGMFHATTADYLKLADGNFFKAAPDVTADALLTTSPVAAFGFLGSDPAAIAVQGSQLTVAAGTGLSLVGGNRGFEYTNPDTGETGSVPNGVTMTGGILSAPSGQINIVSVASPGEISTVDFLPTQGMTMGSIALTEGSVLNVSGDGGGLIRIRGGQLIMDNAGLVALSSVGTVNSSTGISVNIQGDVALSHQSAMLTDTQGNGFGGNIEIHASNLLLTEGSALYTQNFGAGKAGDIRIALSGDLSLRGAGDIGISGLIASDSNGSGPGGSINITSSSMTVTDFGMVTTRAFVSAGAGDINVDTNTLNVTGGGVVQTLGGNDLASSGNISIRATDSMTLAGPSDTILNQNVNGGTGIISIVTGRLDMSDEARINSQTLGDLVPTSNTPKISIAADSAITLNSGSRIDVGGSFTDTGRLELSANSLTMSGLSTITTLSNGRGAAGPILMNVQNLTVSEGSRILSFTTGDGRGGDITVNANGSVLVTGQGTDPFGGTVTSGIFSNTMAGFPEPPITGNAGNISITAHSIEVSNGARIDSSSQGYALGNAGNITLAAANVSLNGGTISNATEFAGNGGATLIKADTLSLTNGGTITSSAVTRSIPFFDGEIIPTPTGNAGSVTIQGTARPAQSVLIDGAGSGVFTDTSGTGAGGNIFVNANTLTLSNGGSLSAKTSGTEPSTTGGTITVNAGTVTLGTGSTMTAASTGAGAAGNITVQGSNGGTADTVSISGMGENFNSSGIFTDTSGTGAGGTITINANAVTLQESGLISASTSSAGNAGSIHIDAGTLALDGSAKILANTGFGSEGHGGNIDVQVQTATLTGASAIATTTLGLGDAGNIRMQASQSITLADGSGISSSALDLFGTGTGNAGLVHLTAPTIELQGSNITSLSQGPGNAGNIILEANSFTAGSGSSISSETQTLGSGRGGDISIQGLTGSGSRAGTVMISDGTVINSTTSGQGRAGDITVTTEHFTLSNGSGMAARTASTGDAGSIIIDANQSVQISTLSRIETSSDIGPGNAGQITITTPTLTVEQGGVVSSSTGASGNAGSITVNTNSLNLLSGGQLTSSSSVLSPEAPTGSAGVVTVNNLSGSANSVLIDGTSSGIFTDTQGSGVGGNIVVNANSVTLQNGGTLSATTSGTETSATGGTITVNANQVQLTNGGIITASTTGAGNGGSITIGAGSTFTSNAGTVSSTATQATGGDININAGGSVTLDNASLITASSNGPGNAGNIFINAGQSYASTNSSVTTKAEQASGGNITVLATGMVHLTNSEINASVEGSQTTVGGNILIDPVFVILQNSQILAQATQGTGGNINIFYTGALLADPSSIISASSQFGQSGTITIQSPNAPASGKIVPLGKSPLLSTSLLNQRCAALAGGNFSSFTVAGRDSLPSEPGSWLSTPLALTLSESENGLLKEADSSDQTPVLSIRKIAPPGFLTQSFATDRSIGCDS